MCVARLSQFLIAHFPARDLRRLVAFDDALVAAGVPTAVNFDQAVNDVVGDLIDAARDRAALALLAAAAARARPQMPEADEVARLCAAGGAVAGGAAVAAPVRVRAAVDPVRVRDTAVRFTTEFASRRRLLDRLGAYKGLHDILHQIQTSHGELSRVVKASREPGYDPLDAGNMPDTLGEWLDTAAHADRLPKQVVNWVQKFVAAVRLLARCVNAEKDEKGEPVPAAEADRALAALLQFPIDEQADLNDRLVEVARDLDIDGLNAPLRDLQTALGPQYGPEFQEKYDQFSRNCETLRRLIDDHDACQVVDAALGEAVELMRQPGGVAPRWAEMKKHLEELTADWPGKSADDRAKATGRLIKMVKRMIESAQPQPDWFPNLRAAFGQFFFDLDTALLDATDLLLQTADVLDFRLRGYTQ